MKIYPNADVSFYTDKPGCWGSYIKYAANHSWKQPVKQFRPKNMFYWSDNEGAKMTSVKTEDLYLKNIPTTRIRPESCVGMLYGTGFRFVRLAMAPPANFKCGPLPVNLETAHEVNSKWDIEIKFVYLKYNSFEIAVKLSKKAKEEKLAKKKAKKAAKEKKKAEKDYKNRTKKKGRK